MKIRQFLFAVLTVVGVVGLSLASVHLWGEKPETVEVHELVILSSDMTAAAIAKANQIPLAPVAKALQVDSARAQTATLAELGVAPEVASNRISKTSIEYAERQSKNWVKIFLKFALWFLVLPIPFVLLLKKKLTPGRRKLLLGLGVVTFGVALGADPSPMGTVKDAVFLLTAHQIVFWPRIIALGVFLLLVVLANKFICSWGCQFGVLQEFLFRLNRSKKDRRGLARQYKPPFWLSNGIRALVFGAAIVVGLAWAFDIIGYIDPFKIFYPSVLAVAGIVFIAVVLVASLFVYRPWCHFACPFGFVSWFFEKLALFRIKVDYKKCIACDACAVTCPSTVMSAILKQDKKTTPDCFACGTCIETCPTNAISFTASRAHEGTWVEAVRVAEEKKLTANPKITQE